MLPKIVLASKDLSLGSCYLGVSWVVEGNLEDSEQGRTTHMVEPGPSPVGKSLSG